MPLRCEELHGHCEGQAVALQEILAERRVLKHLERMGVKNTHNGTQKGRKYNCRCGHSLGVGLHVTKDSSSEAKSQIAGYSIVQAENMKAVKALLKGHPNFLLPGGSIEVHELLPM